MERFSSRPGLQLQSIESIECAQTSANTKHPFGPHKVAAGSLAVILFTSGSTGHSKGVEFTHGQLIESVLAKQEYHPINSNTPFMAWNSFDHCELLHPFLCSK